MAHFPVITARCLGPDRAIAAIARRQHGVFTTAQARAAGLTPGEIRHRTAGGRWTSLAAGVHAIAGHEIDWSTRLMAACLASGGVASHRSAAVLLDVTGLRPGRPEVTVVRARRVRTPLAVIHQSTDLVPTHVRRVNGIPATTPGRLAMDLGSVVPFPVYERAVDDLIARRLLRWDEMLDLFCALSRRGRNGMASARALLLERYGDGVPESALERAFLTLIRAAGLPDPEAQVDLEDGDGFIARVDFAWCHRRVAVELDGRRYHLHADAFEADRAKRNRIQLLGWQVLAYTWEQVIRSGPTVVREVRRALTS